MAELNEVNRSKWIDFLLLITLLLTCIPLVIWAHDLLRNYVMAKCPGDSFLSGESYEEWEGLASSAVGTALAFGAFALKDRVSPLSGYYREKFSLPWGDRGWLIFSASLAVATAAASLASSAQFCLAPSGIVYRNLPWEGFQRHGWPEIQKIAVDCRSRRHESDLRYVLAFKDGTKLDIADAIPSWKPSTQLKAVLVGVPFQFTADVSPSCPMPYADWVGHRP